MRNPSGTVPTGLAAAGGLLECAWGQSPPQRRQRAELRPSPINSAKSSATPPMGEGEESWGQDCEGWADWDGGPRGLVGLRRWCSDAGRHGGGKCRSGMRSPTDVMPEYDMIDCAAHCCNTSCRGQPVVWVQPTSVCKLMITCMAVVAATA